MFMFKVKKTHPREENRGQEVNLQSVFILEATGNSYFLTLIGNKRVDDTIISNPFLPVALVPGWPLLPLQPQEPPSGQRQTQAWEPEGPD